MTNSEVMKGYKIKAKIKTVFQGEIILIGIVREFNGEMICCNQEGTGKPFFCYEHEILSYEIKIPPNTKTVILNAVNEAKIKLGLSNSELSKLIGHSRNYISETLRIGASTEKQAEVIKKIKEAVAVELVSRGVGISCDDEQKQNVRMLNMEVEQLKQDNKLAGNDLAIANRDKNFMKKKLQDKNAVINWLVASNVFFILFLVAKCVGWV